MIRLYRLFPSHKQNAIRFNRWKLSSDPLKISFRVPQGSVIGLLILLLYIIDLHNSIRFSTPFHFANDTGLPSMQDIIRAIKL